jgi:hypothetical protein
MLFGLAMVAAAGGQAGAASARNSDLHDTTSPCAVTELKARYLTCEALAIEGRLDRGAVALCARIYEDLKFRAFDGSFARLRDWFVVARELHDPAEGISDRCAGLPAD